MSKRLRRLVRRNVARCYYCDLTVDPQAEPPHPRAPTIDHKEPLSRGGARYGANEVLACYLCNHTKSDMPEAEFRLYRSMRLRGLTKREARRLLQERLTAPAS